MAEYKSFTRKLKKSGKKLIVGLKQMEIKFEASTPISNLFREVIVMNVSALKSLLIFLVTPFSKAKGIREWLKWMDRVKGVVACEENYSEVVNELKSVDLALSSVVCGGECSVEKMKGVHGRLEDLEIAIERIESGLEILFRRLIKTRASLLNIISQ